MENVLAKKFKKESESLLLKTEGREIKIEISQPKLLFQICIEYTAKNIHLVDSLCGFPDVVGFQIFECAMRLEKFYDASKSSATALRLFSEAYGSLVMSHLNLDSCHLTIADYVDHLCLFTDLTELDISHCGLGADHELLQHLSNCYGLRKLVLRDNGLTDCGIQKITTPLRMFNRGPIHLTYLDLSENNEISCRVSRFLKIFKNLKTLNLSGTSVKTCHFKFLEADLNMKPLLALPREKHVTKTQGWATDIVTDWIRQTQNRGKTTKPQSEIGKFYQRRSVLKKITTQEKKIPKFDKNLPIVYLVKDGNLKSRDKQNCSKPSTLDSRYTLSESNKIDKIKEETNKRSFKKPLNVKKPFKDSDVDLLSLYSSKMDNSCVQDKKLTLCQTLGDIG